VEAARRAAAESAEAKRAAEKAEVDVSAEVAAAIEDDELGLGAQCSLAPAAAAAALGNSSMHVWPPNLPCFATTVLMPPCSPV
jgi:hypothetical protein